MKSFKKKSLKAKIAIILGIVVLLALLVYVLYSNFKPEQPTAYEMAVVNPGTITETLDVNGVVESGVTEKFVAIEGVVVQEVFVNVGDHVQKGDLLATFDASGVSAYLTSAKKDYDEAQEEYDSAKSNADYSTKRLSELETLISNKNKQITAKENEITALENEIENSEPVTEYVPIPQESIDAVVAQMQANGATQEEIDAFVANASQTFVPVVSNDNSKSDLLMQKNLELAQLNSELSALQAEKASLGVSDSESMLEALKAVADAKKAVYEDVQKTYNLLENGWYAQNEGIVTVVNVKPGEKFVPVTQDQSSPIDISALLGSQGVNGETASMITSLLGDSETIPQGNGIVLESYDDMVVSVTVGKSDLLKLKVGMKAVVTSLDSTYDAEVIYVAATADDNSGSLDIGSLTSSLMGGGAGSGGATVKIKIYNPDEKIVIGFPVDIKVTLAITENVLKVPVESVIYDSGEYSVFVYDEDEGTVTKRAIVKGILDDTSYEILDGLKKGEKVLKSPSTDMADGTRVSEK